MAKEFYDWVKLVLDNKWLVIMLFTSVGSIGTGITQYIGKQEAVEEAKETKKQVQAVAEHFTKKKVETKCYDCTLVKEHEQEYHR